MSRLSLMPESCGGQPSRIGTPNLRRCAIADRRTIQLNSAAVHRIHLRLVSRIFASWNQLEGWLRQIEGLRRVA